MLGAGRRLREVDPEVAEAIAGEAERQEHRLNLIASENLASQAVLEAQGSVLTNKYAEGYPGRRYYGGCEYMDRVEELAIERAKRLFGAEHVNVQPHSGSQANMAVYLACLQPGDTIMGMELSHGGHLTHGSPANFSGRLFRVVSYGVNRETELLDYEEVRRLALRHRPKLIVAGSSAYPRIIDFDAFHRVAEEVGAYLVADIAHIAGMVAVGLHPNPVPVAEFVTTTTHKSLRGPRGGMIMCQARFARAVDSQVFPGIQGGPLMHVIAAKAVALKEALSPEFREYQQQVVRNAKVLAEELAARGFRFVAGGTDTHLLLMDLTPTGLTGQEAELALEEAGIVVNKNEIPYDRRGPMVTSGIRMGTLSVTTRGMKESEMRTIARLISEVLGHPGERAVYRRVREEVLDLCRRFPYRGN